MALLVEDGHELLPDEPAAADHHDLHDEPPRLSPAGCGRLGGDTYSTSATDQRASLSGLLVMYTARTPPAMHRATIWMAAPPDVNTTPGVPFTVTACISR